MWSGGVEGGKGGGGAPACADGIFQGLVGSAAVSHCGRSPGSHPSHPQPQPPVSGQIPKPLQEIGVVVRCRWWLYPGLSLLLTVFLRFLASVSCWQTPSPLLMTMNLKVFFPR